MSRVYKKSKDKKLDSVTYMYNEFISVRRMNESISTLIFNTIIA